MSISIAGTGSYLPSRILTNADIAKTVETSDEWIVSRTGIKERRIAGDTEAASDMGAAAARRALESAGMPAEEVGMIIAATSTPDMAFPSTACLIQGMIGARNAFCFDLAAACSGFLYALETGRHFVESGSVTSALIIGTEKFSCIVDWKDRDTCVLFGDGAGAVVIRRSSEGRGLLSVVLGSDGNLGDTLKVDNSVNLVVPGAVPAGRPCIRMNGREVFKHAVRCMTDSALQALDRGGIGIDAIDWVIPHQANLRIIQAICQRLNVPMEKCCLNLDRVGNISAASVPVAIDEAVRDGRVKRGQKILFIVAGAGFTWGAAVMEW